MGTKKKYALTEEHRAQLKPWADKWIANALRTDPQSEQDKIAMRHAMRGLYAAAKLAPVDEAREVFCASPISAAIATCIASGVWWLRENPSRHTALFGRVLSEEEIVASIGPACSMAVTGGMRGVRMERKMATSQATSKATDLATREATRGATDLATDEKNAKNSLRAAQFLVRCCSYWARYWQPGNQSSGWVAYLSFFRHVAQLNLEEYDGFQHYEAACALGGPRFMHAKFWIVADFPTVLAIDDRNRPHSDTGPFCEWADGWKIYQVHGVRVPAWIIEKPASITVESIDIEPNAEIRRVMIDKYGRNRYMRDCNAKLIDEDTDELGHDIRLWRREWPDGRVLQAVEVHNSSLEPDGSRKIYMLPVGSELRYRRNNDPREPLSQPQKLTARNAVACTFGMPGEEYLPEAQT